MAETGLTLTVTPDGADWKRAERTLRELARGDTSELMEAIGEVLVSSTVQRFRQQAGPDGEPWKPLKRPRKRGGSKILIDRGILRSFIQALTTEDTVEVGTNLIYAATHQFGDARRGIPARPFLGITDEDQAEIRDLVTAYLGALA